MAAELCNDLIQGRAVERIEYFLSIFPRRDKAGIPQYFQVVRGEVLGQSQSRQDFAHAVLAISQQAQDLQAVLLSDHFQRRGERAEFGRDRSTSTAGCFGHISIRVDIQTPAYYVRAAAAVKFVLWRFPGFTPHTKSQSQHAYPLDEQLVAAEREGEADDGQEEEVQVRLHREREEIVGGDEDHGLMDAVERHDRFVGILPPGGIAVQVLLGETEDAESPDHAVHGHDALKGEESDAVVRSDQPADHLALHVHEAEVADTADPDERVHHAFLTQTPADGRGIDKGKTEKKKYEPEEHIGQTAKPGKSDMQKDLNGNTCGSQAKGRVAFQQFSKLNDDRKRFYSWDAQ